MQLEACIFNVPEDNDVTSQPKESIRSDDLGFSSPMQGIKALSSYWTIYQRHLPFWAHICMELKTLFGSGKSSSASTVVYHSCVRSDEWRLLQFAHAYLIFYKTTWNSRISIYFLNNKRTLLRTTICTMGLFNEPQYTRLQGQPAFSDNDSEGELFLPQHRQRSWTIWLPLSLLNIALFTVTTMNFFGWNVEKGTSDDYTTNLNPILKQTSAYCTC